MTNATQLRLPSLPIGLGEIMLFFWVILALIKLLINKLCLITPILKLVSLFWIVAFTSLTLGLEIADSMNLQSSEWYRDYFAFGFSFILSICLANSDFLYSQTQKMIDYVISFSMLALFSLFLFPYSVPFLITWYDGIRFLGWSKNPNQLALLLSIIPFFSLYLFKTSHQILSKLKFIILIILCFILGTATQSDALIFAWMIGLTISIFLESYLFLSKKFLFKKYIKSEIKGLIQAMIAVLFAIIILILADFGYQQIYSTFANIYDEGDQGSARTILWKNGMIAISYSPLFGLGPGAHSGEAGPFLDFEAHNTFIDWGSSSGILGIIAYISLLGWIAWQAWKKQSFIMFAAVICLMIFSSFHYVLRHPIFWFYLLSINSLINQSSKNKY
ncbi:O-antigen ligase family protein [Richelia sinica]|uniref:O-antigen ligase family protein n=1 Tax=Richelia sinica TaxID=1357545 RepID=UPI001C2C88C8|nr:O-antigen ligase family protein [Richelia sinica]